MSDIRAIFGLGPITPLFSYLKLSGLTVIAGFCATVFLIADFNFESLIIIKRIILPGLIATEIVIQESVGLK
ncbi:MAG: hypothetical protein Q8K59_04865 [Nitrosomonas sp.]|nr:hypothetical protein [Nitrosomonas sp.]MDP1950421.1 hypothetical protein [Nitrosomonas sp.]